MNEFNPSLIPELESLSPRWAWTRRDFMATSLAAGFALAVQPVSAQTIATDAKGLVAGEVRIPVKGGEIPAYRAMPAEGSERIDIEGLILDQSSQRVTSGEKTVALGPTEYRMLAFFMTHPERVYTREQLLDRVWGGNVDVEDRTIDVHIRRLRKAHEEFGYDRLIQTVRGSGYRFSSRPL